MPVVDLVVGTEVYAGLELPPGCTIGSWKGLLERGILGEKIDNAEKLNCRLERNGGVILDNAALPKSPHKLYIDGPYNIVKALIGALHTLRTPAAPQSARNARSSSRAARPPQTSRSMRATRGTFGRIVMAPRGDETSFLLDSDAAGAVNNFWFVELTPDDWFRHTHVLEDRIRSEFGALHMRAAAGELAGWMGRPDTCLALVVILDQFTRFLYRGTAATACDTQARLAADTALKRGDDRHVWPPGPRRSALYLPFMHSEVLADKRRCVALMREGLVPDPPGTRHFQPACQADTAGTTTGEYAASISVAAARAIAGEPVVSGLPRLVNAAQGGTKRTVAFQKNGRAGTQGGGLGGTGVHATMSYGHSGGNTGATDEGNYLDSDSGSDSDDDGDERFTGTASASGGRASGAGGPGAVGIRGRPAAVGTGAGVGGGATRGSNSGGNAVHSEGAVDYSMQAAMEEVPQLPVLTLNHEHAKRFRGMRLDAQTQQAYLRDRKDVNRTMKYTCLVCAVNHEFRLNKSAAGAEHQHL